MSEIKIKAYCNIVVKKDNDSPDEKGLKIDLIGTMENPYFCIFPMTEEGKRQAYGNCNGYEEVAECEITFSKPSRHECNCEECPLVNLL